jgi:N-acetylglucosamine-6-phosphate deacetylase
LTLTLRSVIANQVYLPQSSGVPQTIHLAGGRIVSISPGWTDSGPGVLDARDGLVIPGLVDIQVNGALGWSFQFADRDHFADIITYAVAHGTTTLLPTLVTALPETLIPSLTALAAFIKTEQPVFLPGIHLEGPFLSPKRSGAHDPEALRMPDLELMQRFYDAAQGFLKIVTLAPELPGALDLIRMLSSRGVVVSAGHSAATYRQIQAAMSAGLTFMTHLGNASDWPQRALDERGFLGSEPGFVGSFLAIPELGGSIIADGFHFHPALIRPLASLKSYRLVLVSDASTVTGLPPGIYTSGGLGAEIHPEGFATSTLGGGWLAGSIISLLDAVRCCVQSGGLSIEKAVTLASRNPAYLLGIEGRKGDIRLGADADLLVLNPDLTLRHVIAAGRLISPAQ